MKPEIHTAWIADLRSGKHEQTTEALCDRMGFCCLGRLTELYLAANPGKMQFDDGNYSWTSVDGRDGSERGSTPRPVMAWAGLRSALGNISCADIPNGPSGPDGAGDGEVDSLANLNDAGLSFPQIADVIEYLGADYF